MRESFQVDTTAYYFPWHLFAFRHHSTESWQKPRMRFSVCTTSFSALSPRVSSAFLTFARYARVPHSLLDWMVSPIDDDTTRWLRSGLIRHFNYYHFSRIFLWLYESRYTANLAMYSRQVCAYQLLPDVPFVLVLPSLMHAYGITKE